ncbi:MAG: AbrB/MazE/SpoVT family DNA-binding domain-containing protein [archaeon]|nr:AbrB/MazE/SpoVT family DNA-binding domain-containing protein [archaeon]MCP8316065.1 AbrB/MazE/SpoVT family DNA-binding domain-containing protein [archaeon]MCP8320905.1 AbrB/MazE/SpoVT family DNA-binding domain-containing protein [archaeon]
MIEMKLVSVTRKGQVTIPEDVRKKLGIKEGSKLLVESVDKELVVMKKVEIVESLEELQRYCQRLAKEKGLTPEKINRAIEEVREKIWKEKYEKHHG